MRAAVNTAPNTGEAVCASTSRVRLHSALCSFQWVNWHSREQYRVITQPVQPLRSPARPHDAHVRVGNGAAGDIRSALPPGADGPAAAPSMPRSAIGTSVAAAPEAAAAAVAAGCIGRSPIAC
eukprot:359715-Chlamydomonas_euryale.AAC.4